MATKPHIPLNALKARHPQGRWTRDVPRFDDFDSGYEQGVGCTTCHTHGACDALKAAAALEATLAAVAKPAGNRLHTDEERLNIVRNRVRTVIATTLTLTKDAR